MASSEAGVDAGSGVRPHRRGSEAVRLGFFSVFVFEDFTTKIFFEVIGFGLCIDVDLLLGETGLFKTLAGLDMAGFNQNGFSIFLLPFLSATFPFEGLAIGFSMDGGIVFTGTVITAGRLFMGCSWGISSS